MRTFIFDMDGVIVDTEPLHVMHLHLFLIQLGVKRPEKLKTNLKGKSSHDTMKLVIEEFNLDYEVIELVNKSRESYLEYLKSLDSIPAIPGAKELLLHLKRAGYSLGLASSASQKRIKLFLDVLDLNQIFSVIISGDDITHSKPAPDIFLTAALKLGAKPKDCIVIEDSENGVKAAKAAGMYCIAYAGSKHNTDDLSLADNIVKDHSDIMKLFD